VETIQRLPGKRPRSIVSDRRDVVFVHA
jgi:hypothetical protein